MKALNTIDFPEPDSINNAHCVESQVTSISELATNSQIAQNRVDGALVIGRKSSSLEVFDELSDPQDFSCCSELFLDCVVWGDRGFGLVCAVQIPGIEAGEVLQGTEELVTADYNVALESNLSMGNEATLFTHESTMLVD